MTTFGIAQISKLSGLSVPQIEQAISRGGIEVQGKGRPRRFVLEDAFLFCVVGELRRVGIDWRRIVGSSDYPWPVTELSEIGPGNFLLLTPTIDATFDIAFCEAESIAEHLRASETASGVLIDATAIIKRIQGCAGE